MTEGKTCSLPKSGDAFPMPAHPDYPKLRAGTQLDAIYERLTASGTGFSKPGVPEGLPRVLVVFDCQCSWSHVFWEMSRSLENEVNFVWYPVCVSRDRSVEQGAALLASESPWDTMEAHQSEFSEGGIPHEECRAEQKFRDLLWENARTFRKAGGTSVPLGIYKTPDGRYIPFFGTSFAQDIRRAVFG